MMNSLRKTFYVWCRSALVSVAGSVLVAMLSATGAGAQTTQLAPTPPMGWNSWDSYGTTIRENEVKANADTMASKLKQYGWQYVVVDIQWYEPNAQAHGYRPNAKLSMDDHGRLVPAANRFPSAQNGQGFKPLADYIHSKGLKFGIHILRGIPRQAVAENSPILGTSFHAGDVADKTSLCEWNTDMYGVDMTKPGGQSYYDSIVAQYAKWGVDFIKADDMSRPYHKAEIEGLHKAIPGPVVQLSSVFPLGRLLWPKSLASVKMRRCGASKTIFGITGRQSRTCTHASRDGRSWLSVEAGLTRICFPSVISGSALNGEMIVSPC